MPPDHFIDTRARTVGNANHGPFKLNRLEMAAGSLFYSRSVTIDSGPHFQDTWLLPDQGWSVTRFRNDQGARASMFEWKLEPDFVTVEGPLWHVHDAYLDLSLYSGGRYELEDVDEFADAIASNRLSLDQSLNVLRAFNRLCDALRRLQNSGAALLHEYAPGLPD